LSESDSNSVQESNHTAEVAFAVKDESHDRGVGEALLSYLTYLAKRKGLLGFYGRRSWSRTSPCFTSSRKMGFDMEKRVEEGVYELKMMFNIKALRKPGLGRGPWGTRRPFESKMENLCVSPPATDFPSDFPLDKAFSL